MGFHKLEVDSVIKSYNDKKILSNIYLSCETGDIIGIFGRNGEGKSTLLKIIFGIEESENKFIKIDNLVLDCPYLFKNQISYLPQDNFIPRNLSVNQSIELFIVNQKITEFKNDEVINLIINQKINSLSGGELRYLEIKLILFSESKFILLDEPYKGISPLLIEKTNEIIRNAASNKGIIITDHNYESVLEIVTKICILKNQKITYLNNQNQLFEYGYLLKK